MIPVNRTYAPIQAFVDELARCGVEHAVTCPGSRNAPLALTLAGEERIRTWSILDEVRVLMVAGERDRAYVEAARRVAETLPLAESAIVAGAGHAAHLERPQAVAELLVDFLDRVPDA